jgi:hypothetical protein
MEQIGQALTRLGLEATQVNKLHVLEALQQELGDTYLDNALMTIDCYFEGAVATARARAATPAPSEAHLPTDPTGTPPTQTPPKKAISDALEEPKPPRHTMPQNDKQPYNCPECFAPNSVWLRRLPYNCPECFAPHSVWLRRLTQDFMLICDKCKHQWSEDTELPSVCLRHKQIWEDKPGKHCVQCELESCQDAEQQDHMMAMAGEPSDYDEPPEDDTEPDPDDHDEPEEQ